MSQLAESRTLIQKALGYRDLLRYHRGQTRDFARHDYRTFLAINRDIGKYTDMEINGLKVLDIGCGQRYPNTLLFANRPNFEAVGVDNDIVGPGISKYVKMIVKNGLERAIRSAVRETFFDPVYYSTLEKESGGRLTKRNLKILHVDASGLPFHDNYFDAVISNAVFEHIENIPGVLKELNRIAKPGAIFHILIHLYPSLSGGHNLKWAFPEKEIPNDVPPWDHLRENRYPTHIYLNKFREKDYRAFFDEYTEILEWNDGPFEGTELLTGDIRQELIEYSDEELLKRYVSVICRPKKD